MTRTKSTSQCYNYWSSFSMILLPMMMFWMTMATESGCTVAAWGIIPCCNHRHYHQDSSSLAFVKATSRRHRHHHHYDPLAVWGSLSSSSLSISSSSSTTTTNSYDDDDVEQPHPTYLKQESSSSSPPSLLPSLPFGSAPDMYVIQQYRIPSIFSNLTTLVSNPDTYHRLELTSQNVTLPIALMLWNSTEYPTLSRARKACRKGKIVFQRRRPQPCGSDDHATNTTPSSLQEDHHHHQDTTTLSTAVVTPPHNFTHRGKVGDRVYPGDWIGIQQRFSPQQYSSLLSCRIVDVPPLKIPVIYQDDYFAIVQKPAGIPVYEPGGGGRKNVRFVLPYILTPPPPSQNSGEQNINKDDDDDDYALARPETCHRLDKPTSGLLVVAKTKAAVRYLSKQFEHRLVQKTYTAIVDGRLPTNDNISPSSWQLAETMLDDKKAITYWKALDHFPSLQATNQTLTLVQLKPQTGRYHQLRRQMAWMYNCPIVGDATYRHPDKEYNKRWKRGLMLCSNRISVQHPYYNTPSGKVQWDTLPPLPHQDPIDKDDGVDDNHNNNGIKNIIKIRHQNSDGSFSYVHESEHDGSVWVTAEIQIPNKFEKYLQGESNRYRYANDNDNK